MSDAIEKLAPTLSDEEIARAIEALTKARGEIDTQYTDALVCPYCAAKHEPDGESYWSGTSEYECDACHRTFCFTPDYSVSYCSWTMEKELEREIKCHTRDLEFAQEKGNACAAELFQRRLDSARERLAKLVAELSEATVDSPT